MTKEWHRVCHLDELQEAKIHHFRVDEESLVFVRYSSSEVSCFTDMCTHQYVKLSEFGEIIDGELICHAHGASFSPCDGSVMCPPATAALEQWPTKIDADGNVFVSLD